jgi:mannose-6-phosphate isomerase-like protein (cupin superfamily)
MTTFAPAGYSLSEGDGHGIWFLGSLMTVKAGYDQSRGAFTLIEQLSPPGFAAPAHVHDEEEEAFYVLEGHLQVTCGDRTWTVGQGGFVFLPRGIPHAFSVTGDGSAKLLQITSPAGFEAFAAEAGEPAPSATLPPPGAPDIPKLLAAMGKYHKHMA